MAHVEALFNVGIYEDSLKSARHSVLDALETSTHTEFKGRGRLSLVTGTTDERLDPFSAAGALDVLAIKLFAITSDKTIGLRVGTTGSELITLTPLDSGKAFFVSSLTLTRNATTGFFLSNSSGLTATVEFLWSGD